MASLPYKISVLLYIRNPRGSFLLLKRRKQPNFGLWSGIGGKLEMDTGESPFECAIREAREEAGLTLSEKDLHLFGMVAEKNYESANHWLMFLFDCKKRIVHLPRNIPEGDFDFHSPDAINHISVPETDRKALWPAYFKYRHRFVSIRADCSPDSDIRITIEEIY